ncbi:LOW QUALITY PROTEIN: carbonic anhydrase 9-like [Cariama cristata]
MQSPMNIDTARTIFGPQLWPIQLSGYSLPANEKLKLRNIVLELPESLAITGGYVQQYQAMQLHLHWGSLSGSSSEHTVNGCHFAVEVEPRENPYYQEILEHLYKIQREGKEVLVPGFNITGLLPANLKLYFHYSGSLTTPSCYQMVKWTVFNQSVLLSHDQVHQVLVTSLRNDSKPLQNNFRLVQDLHGQQVLASFQTILLLAKQLPSGSDGSAAAGHSSSSFQAALPHLPCPVAAGNCPQCNTPVLSLLAGDVLAMLFGVLFAITALAFLPSCCTSTTVRMHTPAQPEPSLRELHGLTEVKRNELDLGEGRNLQVSSSQQPPPQSGKTRDGQSRSKTFR